MRHEIGIAALVFGLSAVAVQAWAAEDRIALSDVPRIVIEAVQTKYPGATIKKAEKDVDEGKTIYELKFIHKGSDYEVELDDSGKILETERELRPVDVPKTISEALKTRHPNATIRWVEEITRGETKTYEVHARLEDQSNVELEIDSDGKILEDEHDD